MTAHVHVPAIDKERVASFSTAIVDRVLKLELGFAGVVISDDLGMKAVSHSTSFAEAAVLAVAAGCDAALMCNASTDEQRRRIRGADSRGGVGRDSGRTD